MNSLKLNKDWSHKSSKNFWGEIAPSEHIVQIYESDDVFLNLLYGFVSSGVNAGDCVIVIATITHLGFIEERLKAAGFNPSALIQKNIYIPLEAEDALSKFIINDWPDEILFINFVASLIKQAKVEGRQVRAFGEMVAILWAKGQVGATVRLEYLWNKLCENQVFCLFCAYPQSGFTQDAIESVTHICRAHSKMITGVSQSRTEVFYKSIEKQVG